jgi:hypothetical protein
MRTHSQSIYVVGAFEMMDRVKIGHTYDISRRLGALNTGSPAILHLWGLFTIPNRGWNSAGSAERLVHERFADFRMHGEWFRVHPKTALEEIPRLLNSFKTANRRSLPGVFFGGSAHERALATTDIRGKETST